MDECQNLMIDIEEFEDAIDDEETLNMVSPAHMKKLQDLKT